MAIEIPNVQRLRFHINMWCLLFFAALLLGPLQVSAQKRATLVIENGSLPNNFKSEYAYADSISLKRVVNAMAAALYDEGYLEALNTFIQTDSTGSRVVFNLGPRYTWSEVLLDESLLELPSQLDLKKTPFNDKPVAPSKMATINKKVLTYLENHGYPFATIRYSDFKFDEAKVSAKVSVMRGELITLDSLVIAGDCKLSETYLRNYLSLGVGDVYDERIIRRIQDRIRELPMVTEIRPFTVAFSGDQCRVSLYLKDKRASQVDGIIGIQPPSNNSPVDNRTKVTADVRLRLLSAFGRGELFDFNWKQPSPLTQDLKVKFNYPFLFNSPFGTEAGVSIYKKDTTYVDVLLEGGVQFLLDGGNYLKVFVKDKSSSLVSTDRYRNATVLPSFADVRKTLYGVGIKKLAVDYKLNPRKGYLMEVSLSAGNRVVKQNSALPEALYDSIDLKSVQFDGEVQAGVFFSLASRWVVALLGKGGVTQGSGLFDNELYRFGGINNLRGFDEESIRASAFAIATGELRYLLDRNSYLNLFFDQGWYERKTGNAYLRDTPYGFGAGIAFDSKLGIFSINYALGSEQGNPILFKTAKVHFGVVNYF